jgi:hypothetical protein
MAFLMYAGLLAIEYGTSLAMISMLTITAWIAGIALVSAFEEIRK